MIRRTGNDANDFCLNQSPLLTLVHSTPIMLEKSPRWTTPKQNSQ